MIPDSFYYITRESGRLFAVSDKVHGKKYKHSRTNGSMSN